MLCVSSNLFQPARDECVIAVYLECVLEQSRVYYSNDISIESNLK